MRHPVLPILLVLCVLLIFLTPAAALLAKPTFTVGSNPYETVHAYPHDLLQWPEKAVYFSWTPQTLPWQGDVTDINNRPSDSYTSNYQQVEFAPPSGYEGNPADLYSWMRVSSYARSHRFAVGHLATTSGGKLLVELSNRTIDMELEAAGRARAEEEGSGGTTYHLIPFKGETRGARDDYEFKTIYAHRVFGNPIGFKFSYVRKTAERPTGYIEFTLDGQTYSVPHLTWGWATKNCNNIFGYSHINADAFFQDSYSVFDGRQIDLQVSSEVDGNHKSGIRYRSIREDGDSYQWSYDEGSEYEGDYQVDPYWKDRRATRLLRGYDKVRFWRQGELDAGLLFFVQHASESRTEVSKLVESESDSEEHRGQFTIETNPFMNYRFPRGYFDLGVLVEFDHAGMQNTETRWNGASHSDQADVLWSTTPSSGWSSSWEEFSHGSEWLFATGFEASSSIGVYKRFALLTELLVLKKYTRTTKVYGQSEIPTGGTSYTFSSSHYRYDSKSETWMTGAFGLSYGRGSLQSFLILQLPLAYLLQQKTELRDTELSLFEHEKRRMWQVQQPTSLRFMIVYALGARPPERPRHAARTD